MSCHIPKTAGAKLLQASLKHRLPRKADRKFFYEIFIALSVSAERAFLIVLTGKNRRPLCTEQISGGELICQTKRFYKKNNS